VDGRRDEVWIPLGVVVAWLAIIAPLSVRASVWGLAVLGATAAAIRWRLPEDSPFAIRRRAVDCSFFAAFAFACAYLAATAHLG
jgi:hypothetical protein